MVPQKVDSVTNLCPRGQGDLDIGAKSVHQSVSKLVLTKKPEMASLGISLLTTFSFKINLNEMSSKYFYLWPYR